MLKLTTIVVPDMDTKLTIKGYKEAADFLKLRNIKLSDENIQSDTIGLITLIIGADYLGIFVGSTSVKYSWC